MHFCVSQICKIFIISFNQTTFCITTKKCMKRWFENMQKNLPFYINKCFLEWFSSTVCYIFGSDMIKEVIIWPKSNFCVVVYNNLLRGFPPWILLYFVWPTYAWLVSNVVVHNGKQVIKAKKVVVLFLLLLSTKCKKVETKGVPRVRVLDLQKSLCCRSLVRSHRVGLESFQVGSFDLLGTVARKQQLPLGDHCWKSPS